MAIKKLHFVYNVDATATALMKDFVHRIVDPETYPCKLCDITYGRFVKKPNWQAFLWSLPVKSTFYTRDNFRKQYPQVGEFLFPTVLAESDTGEFSEFISCDDFSAIPDLSRLKKEIYLRLGR